MRLVRVLLATLCFCSVSFSIAGSLTITPVRLTLTAGRTAGVVTLINNGAEATLVQLELVRWSQVDGAERLEPTRELLATPPIFTVPPGGSQVVRVGLRGPAPASSHELSYRLLLQEVPSATAGSSQGVRIALNISMPVFVVPAMLQSSAPTLSWRARRIDGGLLLRADNDGPLHVQLTGLSLAGARPLAQFQGAYVLPGAYREWKVSQDAAPGTLLQWVAQTDAGELAGQVLVPAP